MKIGRYYGNPGLQINFAREMYILDIAVRVQTTSTSGSRQFNINVYDSSDTNQRTINAYDTVSASKDMLLLFPEKATDESVTSEYIITSLGGTPISIPEGGYITITDGNSTDASDEIDVEITAA